MMVGLSTIMLLALAATATPASFEKQDRQDTIFIVQGDRDRLESFRKEVGDKWTGGALIPASSSEVSLRYWAYSDRTAAEARAFMMPAIFSGLSLDMEDYDKAASFPSERKALDEVAERCGSATDPFFVTPLRSVEIAGANNKNHGEISCLTAGVREIDVRWSLNSHRDEEQD